MSNKQIEVDDIIQKARDEAITEFAKRLKRYYNALNGRTPAVLVAYHIDQIKQEMLRSDSNDNT